MRLGLALLPAFALALAGCGRVGFASHAAAAGADAAADGPAVTGHDEDGDGVPDAIDAW